MTATRNAAETQTRTMAWTAILMTAIPFAALSLDARAEANDGWRYGTARQKITPSTPLWMAGYGGRDHEAEGTVQDLWIRALVLRDAQEHTVAIISTDTLGIPQTIYHNTCKRLEKSCGLSPAQIMLNSSHTHCGPVLRGALLDIYPLDAAQIAAVNRYSDWLEQQLEQLVQSALSDLKPAEVYAGSGEATFAVNRRNNLEPEVPMLRAQNALRGPVDHSVPVLAVRDASGQWRAVVFGYACHNTTMSFYKWCGDYAGYAQNALEDRFPGCVALFHMGCGADQNPLPRRKLEYCESYGVRLAEAVSDVLAASPRALKPKLETHLQRARLRLADPPTRAQLLRMTEQGSGYQQRWASRLLDQIDDRIPLARTYPYPIQVWELGDEQLWITLGGEVVVDFALGFKKLYGEQTWVTGYCNDVMAYIPSLRVLEEDVPPRASSRWGYEGNTSMMVYGMPAERWHTDIEERIANAVETLVERVRESAAVSEAVSDPSQ